MTAAQEGNSQVVEFLLREGANLGDPAVEQYRLSEEGRALVGSIRDKLDRQRNRESAGTGNPVANGRKISGKKVEDVHRHKKGGLDATRNSGGPPAPRPDPGSGRKPKPVSAYDQRVVVVHRVKWRALLIPGSTCA